MYKVRAMPLVKGTRSKLYTSSSSPRPSYITDVEKLQDALVRSQNEVLRMREQMEFLAFLVRRAWQGDKGAINDVANIVGKSSSNYILIYIALLYACILTFIDSILV